MACTNFGGFSGHLSNPPKFLRIRYFASHEAVETKTYVGDNHRVPLAFKCILSICSQYYKRPNSGCHRVQTLRLLVRFELCHGINLQEKNNRPFQELFASEAMTAKTQTLSNAMAS